MPIQAPAHVRRTAFAVFIIALLSLGGFEAARRPSERVHFVRPPSEALVQTLSVADLARQPLQSLWYLHIQPPAFDALRMALVQTACRDCTKYRTLVRCVDAGLLRVWLVVYAAMAAMLFAWLARLCGHVGPGLLGAAAFCAHPASIYFATYLDSTCLSALLVTWFYYELWQARDATSGSIWRLSLATVLLFLTRSAFQWPFLLVSALALSLRGWPARRVAAYCAIAGTVMVALLVKQLALFGLLVTSSFVGLNGCHALGLPGAPWPDETTLTAGPAGGVSALERIYKPNGRPNYNHHDYLRVARLQVEEFRATLAAQPARATAAALIENVRIYLRPSSDYGRRHLLVDGLPWRRSFERLFSGLPLLALLLVSGAFWWRRSSAARRALVALTLPAAYLVVVCVAGERLENMRYKYFLEPTAIALFIATGHAALQAARSRRRCPGDNVPPSAAE